MRHVMLMLGLGLLLAVASAARGESVTLVDAGEARAFVVLPGDPAAAERTAAAEIVEHIQRITDVQLTVHRAGETPGQGVPIRIGRAADAELESIAREAGAGSDAFALRVRPNAIAIRGVAPRGTLHGVYEMLEQLGVRWYMPGELGTVLPATDTLQLEVQLISQAPSFVSRSIGGAGRNWSRRMRLGGETPPGSLSMPSAGDFEQYPERYALVDGERHARQLCVSNAETIRAVAQRIREHFHERPEARWIAIGSHGGNHCQCADCRALDPEGTYGPHTGGINVTDRYLWFVDRLFEQLGDDLPDKRITLTVATPHICPPVNRRGHERLDIIAWPAGYCRIHGVNNPVCPERTMFYHRIGDWIDQLDGNYYERGNWGNIAGPGLLFPGIHRYRRDMPDYHAVGVTGFRSSAYSHWISEHPSAYIGAKLLWNHQADVDALLDEFYQRYYGPAATPMRHYHELLETTARDADHHTGTAMDVPHIYTAAVRREAREHVSAAAELVDDGIYAQRIEAVALALDYVDAFVRMLERRDQHDYAGALAALQDCHTAVEQLTSDYDPPLLKTNYAGPYLDQFFGDIVREAHHRTSEAGELVAGLDDVWKFQLDTQAIGETMGWWRSEAIGGNWQTLHAYSSSWSNQGLRYYLGDGWYRQLVRIPQRFADRQVMLWVGAVDEQATVWVNGTRLGDSPAGAFRPFEFDATDAIRFGADNLVVIRTRNHRINEVGTGGILAPVMFYAPNDQP